MIADCRARAVWPFGAKNMNCPVCHSGCEGQFIELWDGASWCRSCLSRNHSDVLQFAEHGGQLDDELAGCDISGIRFAMRLQALLTLTLAVLVSPFIILDLFAGAIHFFEIMIVVVTLYAITTFLMISLSFVAAVSVRQRLPRIVAISSDGVKVIAGAATTVVALKHCRWWLGSTREDKYGWYLSWTAACILSVPGYGNVALGRHNQLDCEWHSALALLVGRKFVALH